MYVCFIHILPNGLGDAIINYSFIGSLLVLFGMYMPFYAYVYMIC